MNATANAPGPQSRLERLAAYLAIEPDNVALLMDLAAEAWRARDREACVRALRNLQRLDALDADHAALLGRALATMGDADAAVAELEAAIGRFPTSLRLRFELARTLFALGRNDEALQHLPAAAGDANLDEAIAALRIRLLHHTGALEQAVEVGRRFDAAAAMPPGVEAALLPVLVDLGEIDEAVRRATALTRASGTPVPYEAFEPLAIDALDRQGAAESIEWIERALAIRRDDGRIWLLAALAQLQGGQPAAARESIATAVHLMPEHGGSRLAQGWIDLVVGDLDHARTSFEQAIDASPAFAECHGSLAVVEALQRRGAEADALIRKALLLDPECASARYARLLRSGHSPEDVQGLARAVLARARAPRVVASAPAAPKNVRS